MGSVLFVTRSIRRYNRGMNPTETNPLLIAPMPRGTIAPWGWRDMLAAIAVAAFGVLGLNLIVVGVMRLTGIKLTDNGSVLAIFAIVQDLIVVGTAWLFSIARHRVGWSALGVRRYPVALGCALSVALLIAAYLVRIVYVAVALALGVKLQTQDVLNRLDTNGAAFLLTFLAVAIVAPIAEEIFFRGFLYGGLRGRIGVIGAVIVSALFFTILHFTLDQFIPIFVLGVFLAGLYETTGSLWPGIFLHAANNGISLILLAVLRAAGFPLQAP